MDQNCKSATPENFYPELSLDDRWFQLAELLYEQLERDEPGPDFRKWSELELVEREHYLTAVRALIKLGAPVILGLLTDNPEIYRRAQVSK